MDRIEGGMGCFLQEAKVHHARGMPIAIEQNFESLWDLVRYLPDIGRRHLFEKVYRRASTYFKTKKMRMAFQTMYMGQVLHTQRSDLTCLIGCLRMMPRPCTACCSTPNASKASGGVASTRSSKGSNRSLKRNSARALSTTHRWPRSTPKADGRHVGKG
ncbi:hypothetical protein G6F35_011894 [Rhizopus arrhizus]|nr:hypothetical protein G6F35_011894 [Rhizopus arrhizus]